MRYFRPAQLFFAAFVASAPLAGPASAATPQITTDISPVYGLVEQVMKGVGTPSLIIRPGSDPHHYSLRPSEAANIQNADIIFWIGAELTPWLKPALTNLAGNAETISLLKAPGITILEAGEDGHHHGAAHDAHDDHNEQDNHAKHNDHDHDRDKHDDHNEQDDHAKHDDHDHETHDGHNEQDDHAKHDDHDTHDGHEAIDPHAWLDPENARIWTRVIAQTLSHHDPAHAAIYQANADRAIEEITRQQTHIETLLATQQMPPVFVQHAAFAYFENRFNLALAGALYDRENEAPSPGHIARLHALTDTMPKACLLAESTVENNVIASVFDHTDLLVREVNPSGLAGAPVENAYIELLTALADSLEDCARH